MSSGLQIFLMYIIAILMLLFTITIHEIGHFLVGIKFKVNVKELSIGVGPSIYKKITKNGTKISFRLIPLMAYVMFDSKQLRDIYIDIPDDKNYSWYISPVPENKKLLDDCKHWQYILIMIAGVCCNFLIFFLLWFFCWLAFNLNGLKMLNPFVSFGYSIKFLAYSLVFKGGGGNIFVEIPDLAENGNWGLIFLNFFMLMNLVTGVFNLIPFPPLDGYKVFAKTYTHYSKKIISQKFEERLTMIGLIFIFYLFSCSIIVHWVHW